MARHVAAFAVLAAFCCLNYVAGEQCTVVNVDIFYESLCPDSIRFITKIFAPVYPDLKNFLKVNFVPFGKAKWVVGNGQKPTEFTCQHGSNECYGNKAQACALHEIQQSVAAEYQQGQSVKLVDCVMSSGNPAQAVPQCAQNIRFSQLSIDRINSCSASDVGDQLLISMGEQTRAFESPLAFVPTIAINRVKKPSAFTNFARVVCEEIPKKQQPELCQHV